MKKIKLYWNSIVLIKETGELGIVKGISDNKKCVMVEKEYYLDLFLINDIEVIGQL